MKHEIYTTDAFVLSHFPKGETASILTVFTKDFGLLYVHADGLRKLESKLRSFLQIYSYAEISLVRGREVWRVVNAREKHALPYIKMEKQKRFLYVQVLALLKRFLGQEESHEKVFTDIVSAFGFLENNHLEEEDLGRFELLVVLRILSQLGYLKEDLETKKESVPFKTLLTFDTWSKGVTSSLLGKEKECILTINESFASSGL